MPEVSVNVLQTNSVDTVHDTVQVGEGGQQAEPEPDPHHRAELLPSDPQQTPACPTCHLHRQ